MKFKIVGKDGALVCADRFVSKEAAYEWVSQKIVSGEIGMMEALVIDVVEESTLQ